MKLTFEQIISATNGIIRTEQNDLGLELFRFSRDQEGFFYKTHPVFCKESFFNGYFGRNCRTGAGITLDFITDAKEILINFQKVECLVADRPWVQVFDLYIDNEYIQSYNLTNEIFYKTSGDQHRYTIYFPCYSFPIISSVELKDATVFLPRKKPVDILFLGDSITHGACSLHPSNTYVARVSRSLDIAVLNQGNSGFVYDAGSIEKVCEPKIVITAYGINDSTRKNVQMIERDTTDFMKKLKSVYKDSKIVSILPLWTVWNSENENFKKDERACLKRIYEEYSDYIIDGFNLVPHNKKYFFDDVHPNDKGFKLYAENLVKELISILEEKK